MCSNDCPCVSTDKDVQWLGLTADTLTDTYETTRTANSFVFTDTDGFNNYDECIANPPSTASTDFKTFAQGFREQSDYQELEDYIEFFENEYSCAGICNPALFYFIQDVSEGLPEQSCLVGISDDLKTSLLGVGGAALASGIFIFFTFIFQYCLWRKYEESD